MGALSRRRNRKMSVDAKRLSAYTSVMTQDMTIAELEARATKAGTKLYKVATDAGLSASTFYRWRTGSKAGLDNVLAVVKRLEEIEELRRLA